MNVSVTQFTVAPAMIGRSRSLWHEIIDTVIEGSPRTAANEIAEYLERHQYDLSETYQKLHAPWGYKLNFSTPAPAARSRRPSPRSCATGLTPSSLPPMGSW